MKIFKLEKDKVLNKWVVWEQVGISAYNQVYASTNKKQCEEYIKTQKRFKKTLKNISKELDKETKKCHIFKNLFKKKTK